MLGVVDLLRVYGAPTARRERHVAVSQVRTQPLSYFTYYLQNCIKISVTLMT